MDNSNHLFNVIFRQEITVVPPQGDTRTGGFVKPKHPLPGQDPHYGVDRFAMTMLTIAIRMMEIVGWMASMRVRFAFLSGISYAIWTYAGRPDEALYKTLQWKLLTAAQLPTLRGATAELREIKEALKTWLKPEEDHAS